MSRASKAAFPNSGTSGHQPRAGPRAGTSSVRLRLVCVEKQQMCSCADELAVSAAPAVGFSALFSRIPRRRRAARWIGGSALRERPFYFLPIRGWNYLLVRFCLRMARPSLMTRRSVLPLPTCAMRASDIRAARAWKRRLSIPRVGSTFNSLNMSRVSKATLPRKHAREGASGRRGCKKLHRPPSAPSRKANGESVTMCRT
jgi:hypothetical protein